MKFEITTMNRQTREVESVKIIDWKNSSDKKWFETHIRWAWHNFRAVAICRAI